ncbi:helix-turn-helix domain-containing protein [Pseudomonas aeruginosa]|nr:transcriptional regulator [Pseudomonas aeruginosa]RUI13403.1 helix-turn-helix domain-containing protein [Pseudomonas aeruginosa]
MSVPSFGERLRAERERLGFSQQELADICGVTMRTQRNYEKGDRQPDASYLAALAKAGGDVLFFLTGQRQATATTALSEQQDAPLTREEQVLLDNFRHCSPDTRAAIKATSDALAQRRKKKTG